MVPGPWPMGAECARWERVDTRCGGGSHHLAGGRWEPGHPGPGLRALPCLPFNLWMEPLGAAGRSIQRQGLPGAKTETLGQGPLVTQKDPPETLQVPSPLRAPQC